MDYPKLKKELTDAGYTELSDADAAAALNALAVPVLSPRWISARTIISELGTTVGGTILNKIKAAGEGNFVLGLVYNWLINPVGEYPGIEVGTQAVHDMIDEFVPGVLNASEADAVKTLGIVMISRATELGLINRNEALEEKHVRKARLL